jgi:hypothetical protein
VRKSPAIRIELLETGSSRVLDALVFRLAPSAMAEIEQAPQQELAAEWSKFHLPLMAE